MAQTAAQRQAAYRARRPIAGRESNGDRRLDVWVSSEVYLALERLAHRDGITKRQMLERLVSRKDDAVLRTLDPDKPEWDQYFRARS
jgi:cytidylate kinase